MGDGLNWQKPRNGISVDARFAEMFHAVKEIIVRTAALEWPEVSKMPNNDLISRADVLDLVQSYGPATYDMPYGSGDMIIRPEDVMALPAVDAAPVRHGRWIEDRTDIVCGVCGARYKDEIVFMPNVYVNGKRYDGLEHCPHCGAKLGGGTA